MTADGLRAIGPANLDDLLNQQSTSTPVPITFQAPDGHRIVAARYKAFGTGNPSLDCLWISWPDGVPPASDSEISEAIIDLMWRPAPRCLVKQSVIINGMMT
jgi:hypothetical protein